MDVVDPSYCDVKGVLRRPAGWWLWLPLALALIFIMTGCAGGTTPDMSQPYAGTKLDGAAPDFRLTDQGGEPVSLSALRGKVVILSFLDTKCQDVCPVTAQHLRRAYQSLGKQAESVILLGVNVNADANAVSDVAAATREWQLADVPTWHFLTGSRQELEPIWKAYAILVQPSNGGELVHTPGTYIIDPAGQERWYISAPLDDNGTGQLAVPLSDLIVSYARSLLK